MKRIALCSAVVGILLVADSTSAQVPVYLPPAPATVTLPPGMPTPAPPVTMTPSTSTPVVKLPDVPTSEVAIPPPTAVAPTNAYPPTVVDPSPVYSPVPNLSLNQPPSGPGSAASPASPPPVPIYRPSNAPYYAAPSSTAPMNGAPANGASNYSSLPGYGGSSANMPFAQPNANGDGAMPYGSFDRGNFSSGPTMPPGPVTRWMPTYGVPFGGAKHGGRGACGPGQCGPGASGAGGCNMDCGKCFAGCWYDNFAVFSGLDAFKNPVDLDGLNGNFGKRVGASLSGPIYQPLGIGAQFSGSAGWYDWKGTQYTGDEVRFQNFWTLGVFHRSCTTGLGFGVAYDWLYDDYWANMRFGQWRVGASWQFNMCNEIGFWGALPDRRDHTTTTGVNEQFETLLQGNFYYRHNWDCGAWTTVYAGIAESPSDITVGTSDQVPLNDYVAMYANAAYIWPSSGGTQGRQEEIWNLSVGLMFYPGSARRIATSQFRPFFTPADNGTFGVWRK